MLSLLLSAWLSFGAGWTADILARPNGETPDESEPDGAGTGLPFPPLSLSDDELAERIATDPHSLGSLSIGAPGSGLQLGSIPLPPAPEWEIIHPGESYGTRETIAFIQTAVQTVARIFPGTQPLALGDISHPGGRQLRRHATHQAGRDVDFGFYYKDGKVRWRVPGTTANLDLPRNWALVRALLVFTDVETILLDWRIQKPLYNYALSIGEDKEWLDGIFQFVKGSSGALIRHVAGHRTHYHVRFFNPEAQELGRRAYPHLLSRKIIDPPVFTIPHRVREGETLGHLARRYGTTVRAIQRANGLSGNLIRAGRTYRIPRSGAAAPPQEPIMIPPRKLPPTTPTSLGGLDWPTATRISTPTLDEAVRLGEIIRKALRRF